MLFTPKAGRRPAGSKRRKKGCEKGEREAGWLQELPGFYTASPATTNSCDTTSAGASQQCGSWAQHTRRFRHRYCQPSSAPAHAPAARLPGSPASQSASKTVALPVSRPATAVSMPGAPSAKKAIMSVPKAVLRCIQWPQWGKPRTPPLQAGRQAGTTLTRHTHTAQVLSHICRTSLKAAANNRKADVPPALGWLPQLTNRHLERSLLTPGRLSARGMLQPGTGLPLSLLSLSGRICGLRTASLVHQIRALAPTAPLCVLLMDPPGQQ